MSFIQGRLVRCLLTSRFGSVGNLPSIIERGPPWTRNTIWWPDVMRLCSAQVNLSVLVGKPHCLQAFYGHWFRDGRVSGSSPDSDAIFLKAPSCGHF